MKLEEGIQAPVFRLKDVYDRIVDLNEYQNKKLLIGFFRHAGCPFCNLRVHALTKATEEFKSKGLEMIFFFESRAKIILRSSFHQGVSPVPIISDPEREWYGRYGLEQSRYKSTMSHITSFVQTVIKAKSNSLPVHPMAGGESFDTMPAEFLIDRNLIIRKLHYSDRLNKRMLVDEIRQFAEQQT